MLTYILVMLTDGDIQKLKGVFATKDDLKRFATKDDLENVKDDLKKLTGTVTDVVKEVVSLRHDVNEIKETMVTKDDFREVMTGIDKVYGELIKNRQEQAVHAQRHDDIEEQLRALSKRAVAQEIHK